MDKLCSFPCVSFGLEFKVPATIPPYAWAAELENRSGDIWEHHPLLDADRFLQLPTTKYLRFDTIFPTLRIGATRKRSGSMAGRAKSYASVNDLGRWFLDYF